MRTKKIVVWGVNSHDGMLMAYLSFIPVFACCFYLGFSSSALCLIISYSILWASAFCLFWFRLEIGQNKVQLIKFLGFLPYHYKSLKFENIRISSSIHPFPTVEFDGIRNFSLEYHWDGQGYFWFDYPTSFILFIESKGIVISPQEKYFNELVDKLRVSVTNSAVPGA